MKGYDLKLEPNLEYIYFITDPNTESTYYFKCIKERHKYARSAIRGYLGDDGWNEEVQQLFSGTVTHMVTQYNTNERPDEDDIDEDGYDSEGTYWGDFSYRCDYKLHPVDLLNTKLLNDPSEEHPDDSETT